MSRRPVVVTRRVAEWAGIQPAFEIRPDAEPQSNDSCRAPRSRFAGVAKRPIAFLKRRIVNAFWEVECFLGLGAASVGPSPGNAYASHP